VFKENVSEPEHEISNLQMDSSLKTGVNYTNFWNLVPPAQYPIAETLKLKSVYVSFLRT
jgi:hypothetical protein